MFTLVPCYHRDSKSPETITTSFERDDYFVVRTLGHPLDGLFIRRSELIAHLGAQPVVLLMDGASRRVIVNLPDSVEDTQLSLPLEHHET